MFTEVRPGSFEWARAFSYLKQCAAPFSTDVEPAVRWRFFPQFLVWLLGGHRSIALLFPWVGAWALLSYLFHLAKRHGHNPATSVAMTLTLGATAPILTSTGWLGLNDAWVALGLCYLALGQRLPLLALGLRHLAPLTGKSEGGIRQFARTILWAVLPFVVGRALGWVFGQSDRGQADFLWHVIKDSSSYLALAPFGVWMALRFALFPASRRLGDLFSTD